MRLRSGGLQPGHAAGRRDGPDEFRQRVKIYATDVDEDALSQARAASYDAKAVESVPDEVPPSSTSTATNSRYVVRKDLRRAVIFGRNDLVKDAPISRVDLLACRNTLMYMNGDTQRNVLNRLHFALAPRRVLFLGHAEMMLSQGNRFSPVGLESRVFRKAIGTHAGETQFDSSAGDGAPGRPQRFGLRSATSPSAPARLPRSW